MTPEQHERLNQLRANRKSRFEYKESGGIVKNKLSLYKGEKTLTQWIREEMEIMLQAEIIKLKYGNSKENYE